MYDRNIFTKGYEMKYKNGQFIEIMWEDWESDVEYVKGHVTIDEATETYKKFIGTDATVYGIKHRFARWVPASNWSDYSQMFYTYDEKGKGTFPVTELQLKATGA